jgi:hypothetical protein
MTQLEWDNPVYGDWELYGYESVVDLTRTAFGVYYFVTGDSIYL